MNHSVCLFIVASCLVFSASAFAQTKRKPEPDTDRGIVAEEFLKARPSGKSNSRSRKARYVRKSPRSKSQKSDGELAQVGLTVWRLRPARGNDSVRMIVQQGDDAVEWTPERISADTPLRQNDRIRLSFEAPQDGYLYIVDREQYADGSLGRPELIFPTTRTRGGDNHVAAGYIVELPGQDDRPNFFTMRPRRADVRSESLTVIVTPQPLEGITIGEKPLVLSPEQVANWEQSWGARVEKFEMADGAGKAWTQAEKEAGASATRQLTQEEPLPQTIYRVAVKPGSPVLVKVGLRYARSASSRK
ncbi:MAG: DUF4384 domain-containing protein [Blastocatellales bacterium]